MLVSLARSLRTVCLVLAAACGACGDDSGASPRAPLAVQPPSARLEVGGSTVFAAAEAVDWSVREGAGGGSVTSAGLYTAPGSAGTFHVVATSRSDTSRSGSATVTVVPAGGGGGEVLAFPGAEGFGARATGGRGGQVIKVTNLNASGPGSLQAALDVNAPRIVVFAVSGVIQAPVITVNHGNVTIAGQTAPGAGITIAGRLFGRFDAGVQNIIVRHLRVRPPRCTATCNQFDAIQFSRNSNLILDHVSVANGADETIDVYEANDVTVQWSTIETSQRSSGHPDGTTHNYGLIQGPDGRRISFHHNLCVNHSRRCPAIANGPADVRNNVAYNVRHAFLHSNPASGDFDFVGNYFKQGPNDQLMPYFFDDEDLSTRQRYYLRDSYVDDPQAGATFTGAIDDPWTRPTYFQSLNLDASYRSATEFDFAVTSPGYVPVTTHGSQEAYELVLGRAGAFPRDGFTAQVIDATRTRTGSWAPVDTYVLPADLMAGLTPTSPPTDADGDGMADAWELGHGLSPANASDHSTVLPSGYTAIEEYVNELADLLVP